VRRIALLLEYDGTRYAGSQYQDNAVSVQAELEAAISKLTGYQARVALAGRTDAGVHALGQVAAFDVESELTRREFMRGLNHFLPEDIALRDAADVARAFDPRRDARSRVYRYRIENSVGRRPLLRDRAWQVARPLDAEAMRKAARMLVGKHDFAAFAGPYDGSTRRTLRRCDVASRGSRISVEMEAEAFLPHQVRRTVGALAEVGSGRMSGTEFSELLETAIPSSAGPSAPSCGLYLVSIAYDGPVFGDCGRNETADEHVHAEA
jgi:tRNA pseudouridine38-40 synthase